MISIQQQLIKALRNLQANSGSDLLKSLQQATATAMATSHGSHVTAATATPPPPEVSPPSNHALVTENDISQREASELGEAHYQQQQPSSNSSVTCSPLRVQQQVHKQQIHLFHTQCSSSLSANHQTRMPQKNAMSSLAAEPLTAATDSSSTTAIKQQQQQGHESDTKTSNNADSECASSSSAAKPCFNTGLGEILQFMELIGNLKHTKRTGWVLRNVNDCESISGHMYRMSMMTFLLDGSEGLNQIRCMELALVHDLAESLVGDITPFCGVSKKEKRAMEFKAMEDICKLIEPRGKRIMELFHEYELGESAESKFVKDLDRLDMVMQAFEYEKRDNCLLKHQEFFDSTRGKFQHPFIQKLVNEIYKQRDSLARANGATPPPPVKVPSDDSEESRAASNGH